jgi:hypothetical protein
LLLTHDIGCESAGLVSVALFGLVMETPRIGGAQKVMPAGDRMPDSTVTPGTALPTFCGIDMLTRLAHRPVAA